MGHARNAVLGDAIARLLGHAGWIVEREYYYNDAGGQMDRFGASVEARYLPTRDRVGDPRGRLPRLVHRCAGPRDLKEEVGTAYVDMPHEERLPLVRHAAAERVLRWIDRTLERFGVVFDTYHVRSVARGKARDRPGDRTAARAGHIFEEDGAVWFRSTTFGDDKDRVVIRSNGVHTYFAADIAYVIDKFSRGFDHLIYVWGADHHGGVVRVKGAAEALGLRPGRCRDRALSVGSVPP